MGTDADKTQRLTVPQAAQALGITEGAVRARIKRRTLGVEKESDGSVFVLLDADQTHLNTDNTNAHMLIIERLEKEVEFLRQELERKDAILLTMAQRIPELEASQTPENAPVRGSDDASGTQTRGEPQRGFWRRLFSR
jgi:hypothetical protein